MEMGTELVIRHKVAQAETKPLDIIQRCVFSRIDLLIDGFQCACGWSLVSRGGLTEKGWRMMWLME